MNKVKKNSPEKKISKIEISEILLKEIADMKKYVRIMKKLEKLNKEKR